MRSAKRLVMTSVIVVMCWTLFVDSSFAATTIDDSYVRFVVDEDMGSITELTWKGGSGQELEDQYWNTAHGASPFRLMNTHGGPGYQESGSTVADKQQGVNFYRATFTNASHGSKTLDIRWGDEGLYACISLSLTRSDLYMGGLWEPGGNNSNDYVKIYPLVGVPYTQEVPYPGGAVLMYDGIPISIGAADHAYDEMCGYRHDTPRRQWVASGLSLDGPFVYVPSGSSTVEFALTSLSNYDAFVSGTWSIGPKKLLYISADTLNTAFTPVGGDFLKGVLTVDDAADIVLEYDTGQTTLAGGSVALTTSLFQDLSSSDDNVARGLFQGGTLALKDAADADLLTGELVSMRLDEVYDGSGLLAGKGLFEVTGGSLEEDFALPLGEIVQITFHLDPDMIDDFGAAFDGVSDITLSPIPEPATVGLVLLGAGALGLLRRRRTRS